jgi:hypothetical protein
LQERRAPLSTRGQLPDRGNVFAKVIGTSFSPGRGKPSCQIYMRIKGISRLIDQRWYMRTHFASRSARTPQLPRRQPLISTYSISTIISTSTAFPARKSKFPTLSLHSWLPEEGLVVV